MHTSPAELTGVAAKRGAKFEAHRTGSPAADLSSIWHRGVYDTGARDISSPLTLFCALFLFLSLRSLGGGGFNLIRGSD